MISPKNVNKEAQRKENENIKPISRNGCLVYIV